MFKTIITILLTSFSLTAATQNIVVFDFGGVMTDEPNREVVIEFLQKTFSLSDAEFRGVQQQKREAIEKGITGQWRQHRNAVKY